ncbi:hypothetical protein [Bradyrhizobium liaoningense]|uniref:hypothetical protein n=1 Tax=Bradyrhizobium liaoningense TaxID=43992 RepID=UPI001BA4FD31|nr:hypothetical protein [Bradyrhizobium liaoningense]MBR0717066.1 hypothetical protein [Bradyrhizobium liaoningense]
MLEASLSSLNVPYGADETIFVVVDRVSGPRDVRIEHPDLETVIHELVAGCFSDPVQVFAFNTLEHWVKDISADVAAEIQSRCDIDGTALPDHLMDFVDDHTGRTDPTSSCAGSRSHLVAR